ncbi:hypothetical protein LIER_43103 [Lithospermum erythrorhizon]|uniref:Uncharacterized protein n=1 Tax=Lithospermum erythrorhizon TaxID=34254 RepID=A0AAV3PHU7_LITER
MTSPCLASMCCSSPAMMLRSRVFELCCLLYSFFPFPMVHYHFGGQFMWSDQGIGSPSSYAGPPLPPPPSSIPPPYAVAVVVVYAAATLVALKMQFPFI